MDEFSYYNIFDTKGIEYIVVIAFLLLLIPFWLALNKQVKIREQFRKAVGVLSAGILRIPQGVFYSRNHTWAFMGKSGTARVGLDDLLMRITGDVTISHLKKPGDMIRKGDALAEIVQDGKSLRVFSPISGQILGSNNNLEENPRLIHQDPYGEGWIYSIKPTNWMSEISSLYLAEEATVWLKKELGRYKDFLAVNFRRYSPDASMTSLQDGGELAENSLTGLPEGIWQDFQKEFLNPMDKPA
jgi:glycine cleavage system H protein